MEKLRLAICDDEAVVLSVVSGAIASAFKKKGIQVEVMTFRRAKDLEERMKEVEFQLLFLDIDMPDMDGITFAKWVRASNGRTDIILSLPERIKYLMPCGSIQVVLSARAASWRMHQR